MYKHCFNRKHNQDIDTINSLSKISRLSGVRFERLQKIYDKKFKETKNGKIAYGEVYRISFL
jgi:hypothetical protein